MSIRQKTLPIEVLEKIDELCAAFEGSWQDGDPPTIELVLQAELTDVGREVLLAELIVLEIDYRKRRGEAPTKREYLERFPNHADVINDILLERERRKEIFTPPALEQMARLFPSLEIIGLLGAGGMGAVYKARQTGLDRIVALKILPEEFSHDAKFALRFAREARTLAKLNHPNIVSVYEFGKVEDTYFFLMEFVDGSTLRDVVNHGKLRPEQALALIPHLCDALQYAHDKGVIHRDIKPENILISNNNAVKITDFGLSRILDEGGPSHALTGTHQVMGTPRYMAPEQFQGARHVDRRADIYSLGVVFYEMLTGELPVGRFLAPSKKVEVDVRLDDVVLRALETEPQRRYQQASEIKSDVQGIVSSHSPSLARTLVAEASIGDGEAMRSASLAQQELAGRMLLMRRQLMERVEGTLRPLWRGQWIQMLVGVMLIMLGVWCWTRNTHIFHRLISGVILHVYGVLVISQALLVITRIRRLDYSKEVSVIRSRVDHLRSGYLRAGVLIGFIWWLMWIPVTVAIGFDGVLHPNSLVPSLVLGCIGFLVSVGLYWRVLRSSNPTAEDWRRKLAGESIASAYKTLDEIEKAQIQ